MQKIFKHFYHIYSHIFLLDIMAIPENQLEIWAKPDSQDKYKDAHESIRKALEANDWPNGKPTYEVYLQGSYKNSTTIRSNSDVDVVVQLNSVYSQDLDNLSREAKQLLQRAQPNSTYQWEHFRYDVINAFESNSSFAVSNGNKCINVKTPYLDADVVVCMQHRLYVNHFDALAHRLYKKSKRRYYYLEGIKFKSDDGRWIINYPKYHDRNGTTKSQMTDGKYNSTVRIFKNIKSCLVDKNLITEDEVPSYFIQCLLYNVPNSKFEYSYQNTVGNVFSYLNSQDISGFKCQNCLTNLFGNSPDQWPLIDAIQFINVATDFWRDW